MGGSGVLSNTLTASGKKLAESAGGGKYAPVPSVRWYGMRVKSPCEWSPAIVVALWNEASMAGREPLMIFSGQSLIFTAVGIITV